LLTDLVPWVSLDLRELEFCVIGIHALNFFSGWCPQDLIYDHWKGKNTSEMDPTCREVQHKNKRLEGSIAYLNNFHKLIDTAFPRKKRLQNANIEQTSEVIVYTGIQRIIH
jgi:hypothetical protein